MRLRARFFSISPTDLADMISTVIEGGIAIPKVLREPALLSHQILLLRSFIRLLYSTPQDPGS